MRDSATYLDDQLEELEPPYESPAHRHIGRALDQYGIPFFYRQATLVYEDGQHRIWHPDFTLPYYNGLVVEYAGAGHPNGDQYLQHRRDVYALNRIPAILVYPRDLSVSGWPGRLVERLTETGAQAYQGPMAAYSSPPPAQPARVPGQFPGPGGAYR